MEFTLGSKGGEIDVHTQGYKDPPVPSRLVGESQVPPSLSPAYTGLSVNVLGPRLAVKSAQTRTGTQQVFRPCKIPVRPQVRSGLTHTGPNAEPSSKFRHCYPYRFAQSGSSCLDRSTNSHKETYETRTVASQKQLESTRITRKGHSITQVPAPTSTMVAGGKQCAPRSTITQ